MNFSKKRPVKIVMLGAGGTGAHIAPHLYRLLYALERPVKFIICDGDKVEPKNLVRQNFTEADLGENKARVIAERYSDVFGLETSYIPRFIEDAGQLEELLRPEVFRHYVYGSEPNTGRWVTNSELVILIGAMDNNKSRKLCHEVFLRARDLVYIDSGNGEYTGQIVCGIRRAGKTVYKPVGMLYPEVSTPEDLFPTEVSCAEASVSAPQTIVANLMAATAMSSRQSPKRWRHSGGLCSMKTSWPASWQTPPALTGCLPKAGWTARSSVRPCPCLSDRWG